MVRARDREGGDSPRDGGAPAVRLLDSYLSEAVAAEASDLHFEPAGAALRVRMRVDGHLRDLEAPPSSLIAPLLTRVRLLARVDLAERRLPQDGRFGFDDAGGGRVDVRAAFLPVIGGEKIALRLLRHRGPVRGIDDLGLDADRRRRLVAALERSNGLVLVVGPTGSGKSTTLYASLAHLRRPWRSIVSVEDPVELDLEGVSQVAVDDEIGRTFAVVLRALLRQDPDALMVGEIRDADSARIACRAALTGHLILSSLHASDAREAWLRLPEIGVPDYLVRATVVLVVAQRLLRRLCRECVAAKPCGADERSLFACAGLEAPAHLPSARGCPSCAGSGFRGRAAVFEMASVAAEAPAPLAPRSLAASGLALVLQGRTSVEEVLAHCPQPLSQVSA